MKRTAAALASTLLLASFLSLPPLAPVTHARQSAAAEREQGRALLRRGNAAEALVRLQRALNSSQAAGDKAGEAATHDLLGELYERQGRNQLALHHYKAALEIFERRAGGKGEKDQKSIDSFNLNLTLAKTGQMLYRTGDPEGARLYYSKMSASKPGMGALGKAKRAGEAAASIAGGLLSKNRGAKVGVTAGGAALSVKDQFDLYRRATLYAAQELGLDRLDYHSRALFARNARRGRRPHQRGHPRRPAQTQAREP